MKRILAIALALSMLLSIVGVASADRNLVFGTWWEIYYDSSDESVEANGGTGTDKDYAMFDNVKQIEETYGVTYDWENLTYQGIVDSINNSILAGEPDCDVYMAELGFGVPALLNGLGTDMRDVLDPDDPLLKGEDPVLGYVALPNGAVSLLAVKGAQTQIEATYPLAFNLQMIEEANLEDPRALVERGEWTWDKFREYCNILTRDLDGDGVTDVYGYGGWMGDFLLYWCFSNGTYIAATAQENLSSPEVGETLKFLQDLYVTDQCAYPIPAENGWDVCRWLYRDKKVAFATTAVWILDNYKDYTGDSPLDFDMVFVDYPTGPSGNPETNAMKKAASNYYFIPAGVEDPKLVYDVFRAYQNWYHDDIELRDQVDDWWYESTSSDLDLQEWNFDVMMKMGSRETVDFLDLCINDIDFMGLLHGDITPAQLQETYKQVVQDMLDSLFNN